MSPDRAAVLRLIRAQTYELVSRCKDRREAQEVVDAISETAQSESDRIADAMESKEAWKAAPKPKPKRASRKSAEEAGGDD
jgi:hypothetical protein